MYDTCDTDSLITLSLVNLKVYTIDHPIYYHYFILFFQMDLGKLELNVSEFPL